MEDEPISAPEGNSNRTFIILAGLLVAVFFLGVLCIGGYALFIGPRLTAARQAQAATVNAQNTQIALENLLASVTPNTPTPTLDETLVALDLTLTVAARESPTPVVAATDTDTPEPEPPTLEPTNTLVIDGVPSETPTGPTPTASLSPTPTRLGGRTATPLVGGLGSVTPTTGTGTPQLGISQTLTAQPGAATQLPATGFADEAGVPGLILLGFALIAVVIIARRLRLSLR